jgi:hypothetical protein
MIEQKSNPGACSLPRKNTSWGRQPKTPDGAYILPTFTSCLTILNLFHPLDCVSYCIGSVTYPNLFWVTFCFNPQLLIEKMIIFPQACAGDGIFKKGELKKSNTFTSQLI